MDIFQKERGNLKIKKKLKTFGIYIPLGNYDYYTDETIGFQNHRLNLSRLRQYYVEIKNEKMRQHTDLLIWQNQLCAVIGGSPQIEPMVRYATRNKRLGIFLKSLDPFKSPYTKVEVNEILQHVAKQGYQTEIKRIQVKMAVSTEAALKEIRNLMKKITADVAPSLDLVQTDLDIELTFLFQECQ